MKLKYSVLIRAKRKNRMEAFIHCIMKLKYNVLILLIPLLLFSAPSIGGKKGPVFDSHFTTKILTGEKEKIEYVVRNWINLLLANAENNLFPSNIKTQEERNSFLQLLKTAQTRLDGPILIKIAASYLSSVEQVYQQTLRNYIFQGRSFSILYELSVFFDYLREKNHMNKMIQETYISLTLLSLAGFYSSNGKAEYIHLVENTQDMYNFFKRLHSQLQSMSYHAFRNSSSQTSVTNNVLYENITQFNKSFEELKEVYFKLIIPAFTRLSWVKQDVNQADHPSVPFRYGKILHKTYGNRDKGLSYILLSAERHYLPAIKYLGEYYLHQFGVPLDEGEKLMLQFLRESKKNTMEKIRIIHDLFFINTMKGHSITDSIHRGISSLKRSCSAAFHLD